MQVYFPSEQENKNFIYLEILLKLENSYENCLIFFYLMIIQKCLSVQKKKHIM